MENSITICRTNYEKRSDYLKRYRELCKQYDFKVRLYGGWIFFRYFNDYRTYKNQK